MKNHSIEFTIPFPPTLSRPKKTGEYKEWELRAGFSLIRFAKDIQYKIKKQTHWEARWTVFIESKRFNKLDLAAASDSLNRMVEKVFGVDKKYLMFYFVNKVQSDTTRVHGYITFLNLEQIQSGVEVV